MSKLKLDLYKALAGFQQDVPIIHKGTDGYGYTYADLPDILNVINPLLKKHGLAFYQSVDGGIVNESGKTFSSVKTVVYHIETGECIESITPIPPDIKLGKMNQFQVLGSAITYIRRYALSALLGLVTDKDTDAKGEQTEEKVVQTADDLEL